MISAPKPANEAERLKALRSLRLLDTQPERVFDLMVAAVREMTAGDIALLSFVDHDRQWIKARVGLDADQTSRDVSFCAHAILADEVFCVEDASTDVRFAENPFVTGEPSIRSYAGAPIKVDGCNVGTICTVSRAPRTFSQELRDRLTLFAELAAERLEVRRRHNFHAAVLQSTSDAVVAADADQAITYWNAAAERIFGRTALEAIGRPLSIIIPERFHEAHNAGFGRLLAGGEPRLAGRTVEVPAVRSDGREFPIELTLSVWSEADVITVGGIIRDCSERIELTQAKLAGAAKDRFLASMSHEFRTPLNGVLGFGQVLATTALDDRQRKMLDLMLSSASRLDDLVGDVLEAANLQTGDLPLPPTVFRPAELVKETVDAHRPAAEAKGLTFLVPPCPMVQVVGVPAQIRRVLDRLLDNAVKFTTAGQVELVVEQVGQQWSFEVRDTGQGFEPGAAERLFEPFRQGDDSSTRRHGGAGLGLFNARLLAQALGGELKAWGEAGRGSTFRLALPLSPAPSRLEAA